MCGYNVGREEMASYCVLARDWGRDWVAVGEGGVRVEEGRAGALCARVRVEFTREGSVRLNLSIIK